MTVGELVRTLVHPGLLTAAPSLPGAVAGERAGGVAYDSRRAGPGSVFVAVRGQHADGAGFAAQAVGRGALVVVAETPAPAGTATPWIEVPDARRALARLAAEFHGHPSRELQVVGITGTNGKTTTAFLVRAVFEAAGRRCGLLGTVVYNLGGEDREATRTTPEAPDVQQMLREMVARSCGAAVMEVSSHALALRRVDELRFAAAVFTNLTRDHLDFHGDMEAYYAAKRRLFELLPDGAPGVVNVDDPRGADLVGASPRALTYGMRRTADVMAGAMELTLDGIRMDLVSPAGPLEVRSPLVGRPNAYNVLAAVATGVALEVPNDAIVRGIASLPGVVGRFELVSAASDDIAVVVDYAHTDDAMKNLLETARSLSHGRLITVFGCGGDRDRTKRPLMGAVAARMSDLVVVTSDNPRTEDPAAIIADILRGIPGAPSGQPRRGERNGTGRVLVQADRHEAIHEAVLGAEPGDLVVVAGKGHERYQVIGERTLKFDDAEVARQALAARRERTRVH